MTVDFTHRLARAADESFLRMLFLQARPELALLPEQLAQLQFDAQRRQYSSAAPSSMDEIIEVVQAGVPTPAGRVWRHRTPETHRLLDLAIAREHRGRGLGSAVLHWLCVEAAADGVPLGLSVWHANAGARALYLRHGFRVIDERTDYTELQWRAD